MALSEIDRSLLERCLSHKPAAWKDFVDRFMGLFVHVIQHVAQARSVRLTPEDRQALCSDIMLAILRDDAAALRNFRGQSSLATYLTVVARRVVVREMVRAKAAARLSEANLNKLATSDTVIDTPEERLSDREEVARLMAALPEEEAEIVRLYHLEGKSYEEIGNQIGLPVGSVGPLLSKARLRMRQHATGQVG
ncbi:MAG: sigma-70 family RNA polymerase sigma factor [Pirellulales bacterium]|nr:sigma-70 family RNA polymerase sigma factor [Pirellulales bacterium]